MDAQQFAKLIKEVKIGKQLPDAIYLHKDAFQALPNTLIKFIPAVAKALNINDDEWQLVKLFKKEFRLSLLHYPTFYSDSYPALHKSINVNLSKLSHRITTYKNTQNPPILHRKETMILPDNAHYEHFIQITTEGENIGLYANSRIIGFQQSWLNLIEQHGYELVDGRLLRSTSLPQQTNKKNIDRHRTAIVRHALSAPMKSLAKNGFLEGNYTIFDYGCGRGDDLKELEAHGLDAIGWDPNFQPDNDKVVSDIVNIGFVLNVIEDQDERLEALLSAWALTEKLLVVSVMLANETYINQFTPYKDGVITLRNTFQKYYAQSEIKSYIERHLDETVVTVAPGIFYIFKDKLEEQIYLQSRFKRHTHWKQLTTPAPIAQKDKAKLIITQHQELYNDFWQTCLTLGRLPNTDEFTETAQIKNLTGSFKKTFSLLQELYDTSEFEQAQQQRKEDLLTYFAIGLFEKRKAYTHLTNDLKRDIKTFFSTHKIALHQAKELLFDIANVDKITYECIKAKDELPAAKLASESGHSHSLTLHKKFIDKLSPLLRVYVYSALQLYGELDDIQLVKIHIRSGKVTLLGYESFYDSPLPQLKERVKIKMAEQDVDFFDYVVEEKRPLLLNKIDFIDDTFDDYKKQKAFNKRLNKEIPNLKKDKVISCKHLNELLSTNKLILKKYRFYSI